MTPPRSLDELRAEVTEVRARDPGRFIEVACALIVALVDELEDAEADRVLDGVVARIGDPRSELAFRRRVALALGEIQAFERAVAQLRACVALARALPDPALVLGLERELAVVATRHEGRAAPRVRSDLAARAEAAVRSDDPEVASGLQLALARRTGGDEALDHARQSLALAYEAVDSRLAAEATDVLAELLVERDELAEARAVLEQRPLVGDGRAARALYDEVRRRLGEAVPEPPDEPDEVARVSPEVLAYITRSPNPARSLSEGGLPAGWKLREWASREVTSLAELDSQEIFGPVRSFWCACGRMRGREYSRLTCPRCGVEVVHASSRRTRTAFLALAAPVVHPWYAPSAAALLELAVEQALALPVDELRARLEAVDLDALAARCKYEIVTAPKNRIADQAGRRLALVDAFRQATAPFGTTPASIVLDVVLVVPPAGELGVDRDAVRAAYAQLLEPPRDPRGVAALFAAFAKRA